MEFKRKESRSPKALQKTILKLKDYEKMDTREVSDERLLRPLQFEWRDKHEYGIEVPRYNDLDFHGACNGYHHIFSEHSPSGHSGERKDRKKSGCEEDKLEVSSFFGIEHREHQPRRGGCIEDHAGTGQAMQRHRGQRLRYSGVTYEDELQQSVQQLKVQDSMGSDMQLE